MRPVFAVFTCCLLLGLPLGLTACGGDDRDFDVVPATTPELVPPDDANDLASGAGNSTAQTGTTGTTGAQGTTTTPSTAGTTPAPSSGGTAAPAPQGPAATPDTGGNTAPDTGGAAPDTGGVSPDDTAAAGSVQQFCAENPGAC